MHTFIQSMGRYVASMFLLVLGLSTIVGTGDGPGPSGAETPLTIVGQPSSQSVFDGRSVSFTVGANNAMTYQWQRLNGGTWSDVTGATSATYTFAATLAQSGQQLRASVSGGGTTLLSNAATLTVLAPANITADPQSQAVAAGSSVTFTVSVEGQTPSYRWQSSADSGATWTDTSGASAAALVLSSVAVGDNGKQVRVVVSNEGASVTSRAATLNVFLPVTIVAQPAHQSVEDGTTATFTVLANNATGYQWQRLNGTTWGDVSGANAASYSLAAGLSLSGLQLRVVVSGSGNSVTSNAATLAVAPVFVPVAITAQPQDVTVGAGANAVFTVVAAGTSASYRWQVSSNAGGVWSDLPTSTATLQVSTVSLADNGKLYRVQVSNASSNANSSATSRSAALTVLPQVAILGHPAAQSVVDGALATFTVSANNATGYQWQSLAGATWSDIGGARSASYSFTSALAQSGQQLRVVVSNAVGSVTSNAAILTVTAPIIPISITTQPQNATVLEGADAAFAVGVTGSAPVYRWQVSTNSGASWSDILGSTGPSHLLTTATANDNGKQFRAIVSNTANSVTSSAATLTTQVEFIVASGGAACGGGGCGGDSAGGVGGDSAGASAGPGLSAMRKVRVTAVKPNGQVLGSAALPDQTAAANDRYLVSLYPRAYTGPFIVEFADDGSNQGEYFDESLARWLPLQGQKLRVMVPGLTHHISANPLTEAAYQYAVRVAGSQAALTQSGMQQANAQMLAQLNAKLPESYRTNDITNYVVPISDLSGSGTLINSVAGRYGAVMAALPIAGSLFDSGLTAPALAFTRQISDDLRDDGLFNASVQQTVAAYGDTVAAYLSAGICTAISTWGSASLPTSLSAQAAGPARTGYLTLLAGTLGGAGTCDGWGTNARFGRPTRVAADSAGNLYVADQASSTVRKVSAQGSVQTLAGRPGVSGTADGVGLAARFQNPTGIAVDGSGLVYVTDGSTIRRVTTVTVGSVPAGTVTTLAGSAFGNVDGTGSAARFSNPVDLAVDSTGNVYVADQFNNAIRRVTPQGVVTTAATSCGSSQLDVPEGIAIDALNNLYISHSGGGSGRVCRLAPNGTGTVFGAGSLDNPRGLTVDPSGNIYVADSFNEVIRRITPSNVVSIVAGGVVQRGYVDAATATSARFRRPSDVARDSNGNLYVADEENNSIRKITPAGVVSTFAGLGPDYGAVDGTGGAARFAGPIASVADSQGNIYTADSFTYVIRKVTPLGVVSTLAGSAGQCGLAEGLGSVARFRFTLGCGLTPDPGSSSRDPIGMAIDSAGNLFVADPGNNRVRRITPQGLVSTFATVSFPRGLAIDAGGNLYVSTGNQILRFTPAGVNIVFANGVSGALAVDSSGSVYVAGGLSRVISKILPSGVVSVFAGSPGVQGTTDGTGGAARFAAPVTLAIDGLGNLYVGELSGGTASGTYAGPVVRTIRKITPAGVVSTVVGSPGAIGNILDALPASLGFISSVSVVSNSQIAITSDDGVFLATFP